MGIWPIEDAKLRFRKLLDDAERDGPQIIVGGGVERAVVLSFRDYRALTARRPDLKEYLLGGPKVDDFEVPREGDIADGPE